jgi:hypothetical protein
MELLSYLFFCASGKSFGKVPRDELISVVIFWSENFSPLLSQTVLMLQGCSSPARTLHAFALAAPRHIVRSGSISVQSLQNAYATMLMVKKGVSQNQAELPSTYLSFHSSKQHPATFSLNG